LVNFQSMRSVVPNLKHKKKIKIFYKKIVVNSFYLKRQTINMYKPVKCFEYGFVFLTNIFVLKKYFDKDVTRRFFS